MVLHLEGTLILPLILPTLILSYKSHFIWLYVIRNKANLKKFKAILPIC